MKDNEDLITRISRISSSMSKAEARIANVILDDVELAIQSSTTEIAEKAGTSTPTVTRFCRSLGFEGLRDFKLNMAKALALGSQYFKKDSDNNILLQDTQQIADAVSQGAINAIQLTKQQLDIDALQQLVSQIVDARRVLIFGSGGGSSILADDAANRLFRLGIQVNAYHDGQLQRMVAATITRQDVLLVISTSGRYQELIDCVKIAKEYNGMTAAITRPGSPLSKQVDWVLPVNIVENNNIYMPTESRYALLLVIDILATELAIRLGEPAKELMRRIKLHLASYRDPDDSEPLGD